MNNYWRDLEGIEEIELVVLQCCCLRKVIGWLVDWLIDWLSWLLEGNEGTEEMELVCVTALVFGISDWVWMIVSWK